MSLESASRRQAGSFRDITSLRACAVPVGAGLAGDGPRSGPGIRMSTMGRNRSVVTGCFRSEAVPTCPGVSAVFGCVRLEIFSAYEIERRPRGASRINPLLRLFQASNVSDRRARTLVCTTRYCVMHQGGRAHPSDI